MTWLDRQRDRLPLWVPVLLGIGIGSYFTLAEEPSGWLIWLGLAVATIGVVVAQGVVRYVMISVCVVLLGLAVAQLRTTIVATPLIHTGTRVLALAGTVVALDGRRDQLRVVLALDPTPAVRFELPHRIRLVWRGEAVPRVGDRVEGRARLLPSPGPVEPGGYDFARDAYFRSIGAIGLPTRGWQIVGTGATPLAAALRQTIRERLNTAMQQPARGLALAIFTGERDLITPETRARITQAGLAHLLAISGLHIGLVAGLVFWGLRRGVALVGAAASVMPTKKLAALAGAFAAIAYTILVDAPVSAQRACVMTLIVMLAIILDRAAISLRVVAAAAVLILVCWPEAILTPGFQLSFAASAALIAFYEALGPMRNAVGDDATTGWRFWSWLGSLLASSLVAGLVTLPITWFHFNEIVNYGLLGNLIGVPIFSFWVMPAGVLAMVLMPISLEALPLWLMNQGLDVLVWFAGGVASLPGSVVNPVAPSAIAMFCMVFGALWLAIWRGRVRFGGMVAMGLGLLLAWQGMAPTSIRITGDGQALAIRKTSA
jgi:competence protein ComEC